MTKDNVKLNEPFLDITGHDLFLFLGNQIHSSSNENQQGTRSFIEHFEEYIRWEKAKDSELLRERYCITNTHPEQTLSELIEFFEEEIARYQPSVVFYLISPNEYHNNTTEQLFRFVNKVIPLHNEQTKCILLTPWRTRDEKENQLIQQYIDTLQKQILSSLKAEETERVRIIDAFHEEDLNEFIHSFNQLDAFGHLKLGKLLVQSLYGVTDQFPGEGVALDLHFKQEKLLKPAISKNPNKRLMELLNRKEPVTWLFMGDSITHGALWTFGYKDYVECFIQYMKQSFHRHKDIFVNTAVSGATIPSTLNRLESRLKPYQPDIIYVKLGANDVVNYTAAEYKENLKIMLRHLHEHEKEALIILSTPTPSNIGDETNMRMKEYIFVLNELAEEYPNLLFIDQYSKLNAYLSEHPEMWQKEYTFFTDEVLHLGANGQLFMFYNLVQQLGLIKQDSPLLNYYYVSKNEDALLVKDVFDTLIQ